MVSQELKPSTPISDNLLSYYAIRGSFLEIPIWLFEDRLLAFRTFGKSIFFPLLIFGYSCLYFDSSVSVICYTFILDGQSFLFH